MSNLNGPSNPTYKIEKYVKCNGHFNDQEKGEKVGHGDPLVQVLFIQGNLELFPPSRRRRSRFRNGALQAAGRIELAIIIRLGTCIWIEGERL